MTTVIMKTLIIRVSSPLCQCLSAISVHVSEHFPSYHGYRSSSMSEVTHTSRLCVYRGDCIGEIIK